MFSTSVTIYIRPLHHRVIIPNRGSMPRKRTGRKWCKFSRPECATSLETARSLANGPSWVGGWRRSMYSAFPGNCSVSYLSFGNGRSLWAELNGGENSLHWKSNMLPLFSIMTLCSSFNLRKSIRCQICIFRYPVHCIRFVHLTLYLPNSFFRCFSGHSLR